MDTPMHSGRPAADGARRDTAAVFLQDLAQARAQAALDGGGTVLDELRRRTSLDAPALAACLQRAGVAVAADHWRPDASSALDPSWKALVALDGDRRFLALADPWDEGLVQAAWRHDARLQSLPLAAATGGLVDAGLRAARALEPAADAAARRTGPVPGTGAAQADSFPPDAPGPAVVFVTRAVDDAVDTGASDVHFECDRQGVTAKHRVDGVMAWHSRLEDADLAQEVVSRIKVLAQLDITERRLPQDGRFRHSGRSGAIDLRVSIMPSVFGEDAVLRLLDKSQLRDAATAVTLDALGFGAAHAELIRSLANEPSGMVLVTGPTGSGKTTTVYAALSEINTGQEKIITIEDPVEYELPGVLQIPVNERKGLTFAKGLRSILRHDPDRILVGEIRDGETAEIAVQSALTGHLVFTTVHANTVADIMGRFKHFGLDMFGFMSSLNGVVVQRLMRHVCPACAGRREPTGAESDWLARHGVAGLGQVPSLGACAACHGTGYRGRFVLAEVHLVDDELRDQVVQNAPVSVLKAHARARGVKSLAEQAAGRVAAGLTTLEEVKRVVGWL